jgi:hypothetical protein
MGVAEAKFMRANSLSIFIVGGIVFGSSAAFAQAASPATGGGPDTPQEQVATPKAEAPTEALPPPAANSAAGSGAPSAAPAAPTMVAPPSPNDWKFSWNGYLRAPLRIGEGHRRQCAPGEMPANTNSAQPALGSATCAGPGQSTNTFHSPYVPDDQYLAWTFDRQWEQAWAEVFLSYGNKYVTGTVSLQGYDFTDASLLGNQADPAQFGIAEGWVTITPDLPIDGLRLNWKVGAFWEKFGMAAKYDGGHYDTYMFGRTHQMGESLALQYDMGDWTLKVEHGFGAHLEMAVAGIPIDGDGMAQASVSVPSNTTVSLGASPGFTLLDHVHAGVSYKKMLEINAHYLLAWSQDDREQITNISQPNQGDGSLYVYGAEMRLLGGVFGELYGAYSHIGANNVTQVGPAIEVVHSSGGGGHNGGNGIYENFFNGTGNGSGSIDNVQIGYDFSFGYLARKLKNPNAHFWGDGPDVRLSVFGMFSAVNTNGDKTSTDPFLTDAMGNFRPTGNPNKLKYGADLVVAPIPWMSVGVRGDYVQPDSNDPSESFGVISPRVMIHSKFITHEEITLQYSHYWDGHDVVPQQWLAAVGTKNLQNRGTGFVTTPIFPNDPDVYGIKCSIWW